MEKVQNTSVSLDAAVSLKSDEADMGCAASCARRWINKMLSMYDEPFALCFVGVNHYNIVATHSTRDALVSVCYSWEQD